jgi:serine/threonine protein phosphatase PrpC
MTYTEAMEAGEAARVEPGLEAADGVVPDDFVESELAYEVAAGRQAWEGPIEVQPPASWPDRPVVVAIGDGVSSALRSAEISRLATRTAWYRTYYHLHALATGAPPVDPSPWLSGPAGWPAPGALRDRLLTQAMSRAFGDANVAVMLAGKRFRQERPGEVRPTATTLTLVALDGPRYSFVHVGDCSVYHVRAATGQPEPRQVEHNRAAAYAGRDPARYEEARRRGMQNVLTRWLGMASDWAALAPQVLEAPDELAPGDALVLCSDGLDKHVDPPTVARAALGLDARPAAQRLVSLANDRGGSDHIAVALLEAGGRAPAVRRRARRGLWRDELATSWQRHRADALGLVLGGALVATLAGGAISLATSLTAGGADGAVATPTPQPAATPTPQPATTPTPAEAEAPPAPAEAEAPPTELEPPA